MNTNIAEETDKEIEFIISKLKEKGYNQWDEAWVEKETPFRVNPDGKNEYKTGFVLYPELLTYYEGNTWVTIPWICARVELSHHETIDEKFQRDFVKWMFSELEDAGFKPFRDEDAFAGCCTKIEQKDNTRFKLYINPYFPEGYWSNHTL